jgi:hypothetical protein
MQIEVESPKEDLEIKDSSWKEVMIIVKKARFDSAPGPNGNTYKVYKKCPKDFEKVMEPFRVTWRKSTIPRL